MKEDKHEEAKEHEREEVRENEHEGETKHEDDEKFQEPEVVKELEDNRCIRACMEWKCDRNDLVLREVKVREGDRIDQMHVPCLFRRNPWGGKRVRVP